jgi:mannose-6-phosphate isomerase-like protein (cupin superfamily)
MKCRIVLSALMLTTSLISAPTFADEHESKVIPANKVKWGYLNPLRGEQSPGAADLWGDRTADTPTGMLVRFKKGFESPPHIHNITYRGIVIEGQMHNDDPTAEKMWMPTGSFWTQPAGENHTTAANGTTNLIYLEIDSGPYLVKPTNKQFDNGERPLNLHKDNLVWLNKSDINNINANAVQTTFLWGNTDASYGSMIKLPAGFKGEISTNANEFRAVIIAGSVQYSSKGNLQNLSAGSYIESAGKFIHSLENKSNIPATIYIRSNETYQVN